MFMLFLCNIANVKNIRDHPNIIINYNDLTYIFSDGGGILIIAALSVNNSLLRVWCGVCEIEVQKT